MKFYSGSISGLKPILKWPGGKERELSVILPNMPETFVNYFEPFVGGGSVFMAVEAQNHFINDKSEELISLYRCIKIADPEFFSLTEQIDSLWGEMTGFCRTQTELEQIYISYRENRITSEVLKGAVSGFIDNNSASLCGMLPLGIDADIKIYIKELYKNIFRKMSRMKELEIQKHILPDDDLRKNIETAFKSAIYMLLREKYNEIVRSEPRYISPLHTALFFFLRNYAYSGMFRYNDAGDFNVPYGGISYNSKSLKRSLDYFQSDVLRRHFANATVSCEDFEAFLNRHVPAADDFMFLDPPYDSEFSTYANNEFDRHDQIRLANYLIYRCPCRWMMIIKYTDFIYDLYSGHEGIFISTFDKRYAVSFMNRNERNVNHLLITNYMI